MTSPSAYRKEDVKHQLDNIFALLEIVSNQLTAILEAFKPTEPPQEKETMSDRLTNILAHMEEMNAAGTFDHQLITNAILALLYVAVKPAPTTTEGTPSETPDQ